MTRGLNQTFVWLLVCALGACDDDGGGDAEDAAPPDAGVPDACTQGCGEDAAPPDPDCTQDGDCIEGLYCDLPEGGFLGFCTAGCRADPEDDCGERRLCDVATRACVEAPCEMDGHCAAGLWCVEGACIEPPVGCRDDADCEGAARCDAETMACVAPAACCVEQTCALRVPFECVGQAFPERDSCRPNPCSAPCVRHEDCNVSQFCNDDGRCELGCRAGVRGACVPDFACDEESRLCEPRVCGADGDCERWQYCAAEVCRDGCREGGCEAPARCADDRVCRVFCLEDGECEAGAYCDLETSTCRAECDPLTHEPCFAGDVCDEATARCVAGCRDDRAELGGGDDTPDDAVEVELEPVHGGSGAEVRGRVLCPGDADHFQVQVAADRRLEVALVYDPAVGNLQLRVRGPDGAVVAEDASLASPKRLRYPAPDRLTPPGRYVFEVRGSELVGPVSYRLDVRLSDPRAGCFPDARDPADDVSGGATQAGLRRRLDFADAFAGDLCPAGDEDWFCFPMSDDDGLEVTVFAPEGCGLVEGALFSSSHLAVVGPSEAPFVLGAPEPVAGGTARRFVGLPDTGTFTTDVWCARLRAGAGAVCEGYDLTLAFRRRGVFCTDQAEPNDGLDEAVPLDGDGPLANAEGRLPADFDLEVPLNLEVCEGDDDLFAFDADANDAVRAWIVSDDARGELFVGLLDARGQPRGDVAQSTRPGVAPQKALAIVADDGRVHVRVRGADASTGNYTLFVRREATEGVCAADLHEPVMRRNDTSDAASALRLVAPGRQALANAALCNPAETPDEDWYTFDVGAAGSRVCATAGFQHRSGNVDLQLFRVGAAGAACMAHGDCMGSAVCVRGRCQTPLAEGNSRNDGEFLELPKSATQMGEHLLRVYSPDGDQNGYDATLTVVPPGEVCDRDWREVDGDNDDLRSATPLGSGRVAVCDAWICHDERATGDWYEVLVPGGADRTLHIAFEPRADGVLLLTAVDPEAGPAGVVESFQLQTSAQCINVRAADGPKTLLIGVAADSVVDDGDRRVDYTLQVLPTDLFDRARGECDRVNGGLFDFVEWPTAELE